MDSGAEISIMNRKITELFPETELLRSTEVTLRTATGESIPVAGEMEVNFKLGKCHLKHTFVVAENITQNVIIGRDCLRAHGMTIDFRQNQLQSPGGGVPLESDAYLDSLIRTAHCKTLKPQTVAVVWGKVKARRPLILNEVYSVRAVDAGFIKQEPGLMVANSIARAKRHRKVPLFVCNNTNKTIRLNKGNVIARIEEVNGDPLPAKESVEACALLDDVSTDEARVPEQHRASLTRLLEDNADLFAKSDTDLGRTDAIKIKIDTGDHPPIRLKPYRTPLNQRPIVEKTIDNMLKAGVIRPSTSSWSFPIVLVPKKDGSKRLCVDFRKLNRITRKYTFPLPLIDDVLAGLGNSKFFSSLDLRSGYWQVPVDEKDKPKTALVCHKGIFEHNYMPMGLMNAGSYFQELMTHVLEGIGSFATAYLDDIIVFSPNEQDHLRHLTEVFDRLRKFGLKMKMSKCEFMQPEIKYLGFVVNQSGIQADPDKVQVIKEMSPPSDVRGVRGFIGCVSYYRRFCPNFSQIAMPLIELTRKHSKFDWTDDCQTAFERLKNLLTEAPTLAFPDMSREYTLYTDASTDCIGAVLTQDLGRGQQPIHFLSHKLSQTQRKWPIVEKEAYAIYYALQKLDHYLHGAKFTIKCDHKPLKYLLTSEMKNRKVQMWAIAISGYNCDIEYIKGKDNEQADLLSRLFHPEPTEEAQPIEVAVINSNRIKARRTGQDEQINRNLEVSELELPDMVKEQREDVELAKLRKTLEDPLTANSVRRRYVLVNDLAYYLGNDEEQEPRMKLLIPEKYKARVLKQYHDDCAHWGIEKTFSLIRQNYHWVGLYRDVVRHVTQCVTCNARGLRPTKVPLQEMDPAEYPGQKWGLDLCGPYPESASGSKYILTAVDLYSGWPEMWALPSKSSESIVQLLIDELIPRFSCPESMVSDNGAEFRSQTMSQLLQELNIQHIYTSPYHPQGNSKTERFHRCLNDMLSKKTSKRPELWDQYLSPILAAYRAGISESTGYSPFFLMYMRDPVLPLDNLLKPRRKYYGVEYHRVALERQHEAFTHVHRNLRKARARQKRYHDRGAVQVEFHVGDPVYLRNHCRHSKLDDRWISHYRVIEVNSPVTCTVRNQLTGDVRRAHIEHLVKASLDWPMPAPRVGKRKARYATPPENWDGEESEEAPEAYWSANESDSEDEVPLARLRERWADK